MATKIDNPNRSVNGFHRFTFLALGGLAALLAVQAFEETAKATSLDRLVVHSYASRGYALIPRGLRSDFVDSSVDSSGAMFLRFHRNGRLSDSKLVRIKRSGGVDPRFGVVKLPNRWKIGSIYSHVAGGVLVANFDPSNTSDDAGRIVLRRYTRAGKLDTKFGQRGRVSANRLAKAGSRPRLIVMPDGTLVTASRVSATSSGAVLSGTTATELRYFDRLGRPIQKFGSAGVVRLPELVGDATARPGIPGGLIVSSIDRIPPVEPGELAAYSPVVRLRALQPDGSLDATWGNGGSYEWRSAPPAIVAEGLRACDCGSRNFRFSEPKPTVTSLGLLLVTHEMTDPNDDANVTESLYWQSWVSFGGEASSIREDSLIGVSDGLGEGDPGEDVFHTVSTTRTGRTVMADSYSDCYYTPCDHEMDLISITPTLVKPRRSCVTYFRKERGRFGLAGASNAGIHVFTSKGRRVAIALIPYSRVSKSCG